MTVVLAIDTSTDEASVALVGEQRPCAELSWITGANHSRYLDQAVKTVLSYGEARLEDVEGIAVALGPGSFNGLRVGVSYALGLAFGLDILVTGVPTLDIIGLQAARGTGRVYALIPAGRGEVYISTYEGEGEEWSRVGEYGRVATTELAISLEPTDLLAGPAAQAVAGLAWEQGKSVRLVDPARGMRRASFLAELGKQRAQGVAAGDFDAIRPLYLRQSSAEEKRAASRG